MNLVSSEEFRNKLKNGECFAPLEDKSKILDYLKSNSNIGYSSGYVIDKLTNKETDISYRGYKEKDYLWTSDDIYHFEKYNLPLKSEFLDYVRSKIN